MSKLPIPQFEPTHIHFPNWVTAVPIIKSYLPRKLQFAVIPESANHGRVDVDSSWFVALSQVCPPEDHMKLEELGSKAVALIMGRWQEYAEFSGLMNRNLTPSLMVRLNNLIDTVDRVAETEGEPTNLQVIRHMFGIAPVPGHPLRNVKVVATIDHEKLRGLNVAGAVVDDANFMKESSIIVHRDPNPDRADALLGYKGHDFLSPVPFPSPNIPYIPVLGPESVTIDLKNDPDGRTVLTLHRYDVSVPYRHLGVALLNFTMFKPYLSQYIDKADLVYFEEDGSDFKTRCLMKDRHTAHVWPPQTDKTEDNKAP